MAHLKKRCAKQWQVELQRSLNETILLVRFVSINDIRVIKLSGSVHTFHLEILGLGKGIQHKVNLPLVCKKLRCFLRSPKE